MPLHGTPSLETYHPQLAYCVLQFVTKGASQACGGGARRLRGRVGPRTIGTIVIDGMLRFVTAATTAATLLAGSAASVESSGAPRADRTPVVIQVLAQVQLDQGGDVHE